MPQLAVWKLDRIKPDPKQPRKHFDQTDLKALGCSLRDRGQLQPIGVRPDGTLLWGERRYRAAVLVELPTLDVIVTDRAMSDSEIRLVQITENMHRADLTGSEKWLACAELMCMNPAWQMKDLAEALHLDPSMVTRLLSPSRCIPAAQEALAAGKIGISTCYTLSKCATPEEQAKMLAAALNGTSRDELEAAGRKKRNGTTEAVRVQKVKCVLPSGVNVVVSGEGVSLDESIEALGLAIKEMRRAKELGYTAKTFAAAMKDKAKAAV
jgi:ParB family transcriptional regulator, chromosome partitioning protein